MFYRDDVYVRERLADLRRTAASLHRAEATHDGVLARTRRTLGRALIAVGSAVAGAGGDLRDQADARNARDAGLLA